MARDPTPRDTWEAGVSGPMGSQPSGGPERPVDDELPPVGGLAPPDRREERGRYTRDGLLGRGGMGLVYLARDHRLGRSVALKEAARGGDVAARLEREARVTAGLEHPGIVTVHDAGVTEDGRPFYTMHLLRGRPLSAVLAERSTLPGRLGLLRHHLDACNAVAYARAEGVIHRDLKPANIMVGGFGETQVVDWGLATRVGEAVVTSGDIEPTDAVETRVGAVLGTPAYMSPEQARGESVDARADVWSLGAVLYEILTGVSPRGAGAGDQVLVLARAGFVPPLRHLADAPPELITIAEHALAADPAVRYQDAGALAADVSAWLDGRPVDAHRYTPYELLLRLVRAWRAPLLVGGGALLLVIVLLAVGTWRIAQERDRVVEAEREARAALKTSDTNLASALVTQAHRALDEGRTAYAAVLATHALVLEDSPEARGVLSGVATEARPERQAIAPLPECNVHLIVGWRDVICVGASSVSRIVATDVRWEWKAAPGRVRMDGGRVFVADGADAISLDVDSGAVETGWRPFGAGGAWAPVKPAEWGEVDVPGATNRMYARLCPGATLAVVTVSVEGRVWVALCTDGRVGSASIGEFPARYLPTPATREALSGAIDVTLTPDLLVRIPVRARSGRFLPDGTLVLADRTLVSRWRLPPSRGAALFSGPDGVTAAVYSPDGRLLATAHGRERAIVWDLLTGARRADLDIGEGTAKGVAFTADSSTAWFAMTGAGAAAWRPLPLAASGGTGTLDARPLPTSAAGAGWPSRRIVILRSNVLIALGYVPGLDLVMDALTLRTRTLEVCPSAAWSDAGQAPGGEYAVLVGAGGVVVRVESGPVPRCGAIWNVDGAGSGDVDAAGEVVVGLDNAVLLLDSAGHDLWRAPWPDGRVLDVSISADGRWIAAGGTDHLARVWDWGGRLRAVLAGHAERVASVDFRPDGRQLATGSWDRTARLWGLDVLEEDVRALDARSSAEWGLSWTEALEGR